MKKPDFDTTIILVGLAAGLAWIAIIAWVAIGIGRLVWSLV